MRTEFAEIPGFPGYRVSNTGIVQSCRTNGGRIGLVWRDRVAARDKDGYRKLCIHKNRSVTFVAVHSLVLMAFVGPKPTGCLVRHLNGRRDDNRLENLAWGTPIENSDDRRVHGHTAEGERNGNARISAEAVIKAKILRSENMSYSKIARAIGVSKRQAMRIVKGEAWKCLSIASPIEQL